MSFIRCIFLRLGLFAAFLTLGTMPLSQAQANDIVEDSVRDFTTVMVIGAGGAILGLSTLSFVEKPKNHLRNILIGGAVGIIVGVGYVAYKQANTSKAIIESSSIQFDAEEFSTVARSHWHEQAQQRVFESAPLPQMVYQFTF